LEINGKKIDFTGGRGYIEKDWGISFPKAWVWMQTNHFSQPGICLTASTAIIPWRGHTFNGFIAGLWNNGRLERFATYTGAQLVETAVTDTEVRMVMAQRARRLELTASRAEGGILQAPTTTQMNRRITETLSAHVHVKLLSRKGSTWITEFDDTGRHAGLEAMGQLNG
jgi:tocopherol cyclase